MTEPLPVLVTSSVTLKPVADEHVEAIHRHWNRPHVNEYKFDGHPVSRRRVQTVVHQSVAGFESTGYAVWVIAHPTVEEAPYPLGGVIGLGPLEDGSGTELFYSLEAALRGSGFATIASRLVLQYAIDIPCLRRIVVEIDAGNAASHRVAQRLGMQRYAVVPGALGDLVRYEVSV